MPRLVGDPALLTHPQAPNIDRLVAAGTLANLSVWQVLAASGVFVAAPSRPRSALLAGTGAKVGYAYPLGGARPGGPGRFAVTHVHRLVLSSLDVRFSPARGDAPLVAYARGFIQPEPVLWGAVRVDDFSLLAASLPADVVPMLPAGAEIGVAHLFFGVRSRVSGDTRIVLDLEDAATAHAVGLLLRDALGDLARDGLWLAGERLRIEGTRVELRFWVDARLLRQSGGPAGDSRLAGAGHYPRLTGAAWRTCAPGRGDLVDSGVWSPREGRSTRKSPRRRWDSAAGIPGHSARRLGYRRFPDPLRRCDCSACSRPPGPPTCRSAFLVSTPDGHTAALARSIAPPGELTVAPAQKRRRSASSATEAL